MRPLGADFSVYTGNVDWEKAKSAGLSFMYTRACWLYEDTRFKEYWKNAKSVLPRAAYAYLDWRGSISKQADLFCKLIENDIGELPPILDLEMNPAGYPVLQINEGMTDLMPSTRKVVGATKNPYGLKDRITKLTMSGSEVRGQVWNWLQTVEKRTGRVPMLYSGFYYWSYWMSSDVSWKKYPFILAWYAPESWIKVPKPWEQWTMWQYTGNGNGPQYGSQGLSLDMDWFYSQEELDKYLGVPQTPTPEPPPVPVLPRYKTLWRVNVRSSPTVGNNWIGYLEANTVVTADIVQNGWIHFINNTVPSFGKVTPEGWTFQQNTVKV